MFEEFALGHWICKYFGEGGSINGASLEFQTIPDNRVTSQIPSHFAGNMFQSKLRGSTRHQTELLQITILPREQHKQQSFAGGHLLPCFDPIETQLHSSRLEQILRVQLW